MSAGAKLSSFGTHSLHVRTWW